jgi:hypothetical protein
LEYHADRRGEMVEHEVVAMIRNATGWAQVARIGQDMNLTVHHVATLWHTLGIDLGEPITPRNLRRNWYCCAPRAEFEGEMSELILLGLMEIGAPIVSSHGVDLQYFHATLEGERVAAEIHAQCRAKRSRRRWSEVAP